MTVDSLKVPVTENQMKALVRKIDATIKETFRLSSLMLEQHENAHIKMRDCLRENRIDISMLCLAAADLIKDDKDD